jgi:hypothetical protein
LTPGYYRSTSETATTQYRPAQFGNGLSLVRKNLTPQSEISQLNRFKCLDNLLFIPVDSLPRHGTMTTGGHG